MAALRWHRAFVGVAFWLLGCGSAEHTAPSSGAVAVPAETLRVVRCDTLRTVIRDTAHVVVHKTVRHVVHDTLRTVVFDTIRALAVGPAATAPADSITGTVRPLSQEALLGIQTAIDAGRLPPEGLAYLTCGVPELCRTAASKLTAQQRGLLAQASGIPDSSLAFLRWGRYASPSGHELFGATFLAVWSMAADPMTPVVVTVDTSEHLRRR